MKLEDRVAWILNLKKDELGLNNIGLGRLLGVNKNTAQAYTKGKGDLKGNALENIVKHLKVNGEWLISGKGEPFPGACLKFPEVCGPSGLITEQIGKIDKTVKTLINSISGVNELNVEYETSDTLFSSNQKINIEEAMGKAYKVLNAGTALSVALYMNIQQFAAALDTGQELKECKNLIKAMQNQIDDLNAKVDRLTAPSITGRQADGSEK